MATYPITKFRNNIFKILAKVHYGEKIIISNRGVEYEVTKAKTRADKLRELRKLVAKRNKESHTFDGITREMKIASIKEGRL
jgi:prevent-host-death family protein